MALSVRERYGPGLSTLHIPELEMAQSCMVSTWDHYFARKKKKKYMDNFQDDVTISYKVGFVLFLYKEKG